MPVFSLIIIIAIGEKFFNVVLNFLFFLLAILFIFIAILFAKRNKHLLRFFLLIHPAL